MFRLPVALAAVSQCLAARASASVGNLAEVEAHSVFLGPLRFKYPEGFALGNTLMLYWNARARALLTEQGFKIVGSASQDEILASLPADVKHGQVTKKQRELYGVLRSLPNVCFHCAYPHAQQYALWHLITGTVFQETSALVMHLAAGRPAPPSHNFAAVHIRCDPYIMDNHGDYGVLPHRFVAERVPRDVSRVIIVGTPKAMDEENFCGKSTRDLQQHLEETRHLKVELRNSGDEVSDWLFLSQAPVLFCAPSTFCFTAALGNPNSVFMPVNPGQMCVSPPGPQLGTRSELMRSGFHWVDTDFLPGRALKAMSWPEVQQYLHSDACDQARFGCTPVKS